MNRLQAKSIKKSFALRLKNSQEFQFLNGRTHSYTLKSDELFKELLAMAKEAQKQGLLEILQPKDNPTQETTQPQAEVKSTKRSKK